MPYKNKKKKAEYNKQYRQAHKIEKSEYNKQYRKKNKDYFNNKQKQFYQKNKDYYAEKNKQYRNTPVGRAYYLLKDYIRDDRDYRRISDELPLNYVTVADVVRLITKKCAHFDECGTYGWRKIGLNRLDNSKPHTIDNVEPCCFKCNIRLPRK